MSIEIGPFETGRVHEGDCLELMRELPDGCIQCVITSPPYWGLRDYGVAGQFGLEATPQEYIEKMVEIFREVKRALRKDGTLWLNLGDCYTPQSSHAGGTMYDGLNKERDWSPRANALKAKKPFGKPKDLMGMPWRVAFALQDDGWWLRSDIVWHKPNPMPESVKDRPTRSHEFIFLMIKSAKYYYDYLAIREPYTQSSIDRADDTSVTTSNPDRPVGFKRTLNPDGRNKRDVWMVTSKPYKGAHFATFPEELILPCILAGCPEGGIVLDPFMGSGTVGIVAVKTGRQFLGFEISEEYTSLANDRINATQRNLSLSEARQRQGSLFK